MSRKSRSKSKLVHDRENVFGPGKKERKKEGRKERRNERKKERKKERRKERRDIDLRGQKYKGLYTIMSRNLKVYQCMSYTTICTQNYCQKLKIFGPEGFTIG